MAEQFKTYESIARTREAARERQPVRGDVYEAQMQFMFAQLCKTDRQIMELRRKLEQKA